MSAWAQSQKRNVITKRPAGGGGVAGTEDRGCWTLYLSCFKTARWTGVDITEIDAELFPELCSSLDSFLLGTGEREPLRSLLKP